MPRTSMAQWASALSLRPSWYSVDLLPELQGTLATLADLEVRYQADREQLQSWDGPEGIKERFAAQLEARYRQERHPYVQRLEQIQDQLRGQISVLH